MFNPYYYFRYQIRRQRLYPYRYARVLDVVYQLRASSLLEIGLFQGARAMQMIQTARIFHRPSRIQYYGFDLFDEGYSEETQTSEFSKHPLKKEEIEAKLKTTGAAVELLAGDSRTTVKRFAERGCKVDLAYVDGGHSFETIQADWENSRLCVRKGGVIVFDDYYHNQEMTDQGFGCQKLVHDLQRTGYRVKVFDTIDTFGKDWGNLMISMAAVWV